jgi:hypothetical protein
LILAAAILGGLAIWPLWRHAHAAAAELGFRDLYGEVRISVPDWRSWVYLGPHSWLYGRLPKLLLFHGIPLEPEHRLGVGLVTPLVAAVGLYLGRGRPWAKLSVLAWVGVLFCVTFIGRPIVLNVSLLALAVCVTWLVLDPVCRRRPVVLAASAGALTAALVPLPVLGMTVPGLAAALVVAGLLRFRGLASGPGLWTYPLAAFLFFGCFVTYMDYLPVWGLGTLAIAAGSVAMKRRGVSVPSVWLVVVTLVPALVLLIFDQGVYVWPFLFRYVFGANAIRAVGRVSLVLLIPASVGVALAFDALGRRGWTAAACALGLICALEQGVSTPSYDKFAERAHAHEVARRVPPGCEAFFASSLRPVVHPWAPHLDAMWAELECGVPTINGYSGGLPKGWFPLYEPGPGADQTLADWARARGLDLSRVCWIGGRPGARGMMKPVGASE